MFIQLTKFRCGGLSVGMRWAHVLGDAFSASECLNTWAKIMANQSVPTHLDPNIQSQPPASTPSSSPLCRSVKQLPPLGDNWLAPNNSKMQANTFHITEKTLAYLLRGKIEHNHKATPFEAISAIVWKCLAKTRNITIVTVCKNSKQLDRASTKHTLPSNTHQTIGTVEAHTIDLIRNSNFLEIARLISEEFVDETKAIEQRMEEGNGSLDFLVYGSNLTFVDWEDAELWRLELNGLVPIFADSSIQGVGNEGAVVVVGNGGGRTVNVMLAGEGMQQLKDELMKYGIL